MLKIIGNLKKNKIDIDDTWKSAKIVIKLIGFNNEVILSKTAQNMTNAIIKLTVREGSVIKLANDCKVTGQLTLYAQNHSLINIDDKSTFNANVRLLLHEKSSLKIGRDCMIGAGVTIQTSDMHSIISLDNHKRMNPAKDIIIKNHVWVGANSTILKGVICENNSVIGSSSVVTKKVNENCLVAGVPALLKKENITWDRKLL